MTNYICINGKKAELTEEQMKALGIELPKKPSPFERVCNHANDFYSYYFITSYGTVTESIDSGFGNGNSNDDLRYRSGNYCTDESIMRQRALHETLNRLLWRYSMEHDGDKIEWHSDPNQNRTKGFIYYNHIEKKFEVHTRWDCQFFGAVWFNTYEIAEAAIKEVVKPFMKAHPEFKW